MYHYTYQLIITCLQSESIVIFRKSLTYIVRKSLNLYLAPGSGRFLNEIKVKMLLEVMELGQSHFEI